MTMSLSIGLEKRVILFWAMKSSFLYLSDPRQNAITAVEIEVLDDIAQHLIL